jgi:peptidoglycan LD-endopeptidase LytH
MTRGDSQARTAATRAQATAAAIDPTATPQAGASSALPTPSAGSPAPASATSAPSAAVPPAAQVDAGPATATTDDVGPRGLIVPVSGVAATALADTYGDARSGERQHQALDIMAPAGTPVVATADGRIEKLFTSDKGGLTIYQFEPGGRYVYYYAHLQRYAPGLAEKQQVKQGDVIGYVGSTGNADPGAPHLHFGVSVLGPERQWWKSTPIDPYPLLRKP